MIEHLVSVYTLICSLLAEPLNQQALITILGDAGARAREELRGCRALLEDFGLLLIGAITRVPQDIVGDEDW
jgi:hypothetical protein